MTDRSRRAPGRIEQPADPADVRAVGYGPGDVVQVPERYAEPPVHKEKSGRAAPERDLAPAVRAGRRRPARR